MYTELRIYIYTHTHSFSSARYFNGWGSVHKLFALNRWLSAAVIFYVLNEPFLWENDRPFFCMLAGNYLRRGMSENG